MTGLTNASRIEGGGFGRGVYDMDVVMWTKMLYKLVEVVVGDVLEAERRRSTA